MITGSADHGLYMIQSREFNYYLAYIWLVSLIFFNTAMSSFLHYLIIITSLSFLYQLDQ